MDTGRELFERVLVYPDVEARRRLDGLVGLDGTKSMLAKTICVFLDPGRLYQWAARFHDEIGDLLDMVIDRPPLLILGGDVGTGKTALAECIGDRVARDLGISVTLFSISLSARGTGRVGEMTKLVSSSFEFVRTEAAKFRHRTSESPRAGVLFLIDEADALAQSREMAQMHHEDRAGVNAFIRGIDHISASRVPAVVIMCTNRLSAIDPAVQRRAAEIVRFSRPNKTQAEEVLRVLSVVGLTAAEISHLAEITTSADGGRPGFTYSDLTQRVLPMIVLRAFPDGPIGFKIASSVVAGVAPTPMFQEQML